jgi:hypothetical protein
LRTSKPIGRPAARNARQAAERASGRSATPAPSCSGIRSALSSEPRPSASRASENLQGFGRARSKCTSAQIALTLDAALRRLASCSNARSTGDRRDLLDHQLAQAVQIAFDRQRLADAGEERHLDELLFLDDRFSCSSL